MITNPRSRFSAITFRLHTVPLPAVFLNIYKNYNEQLTERKTRDDIEFDTLFFNANPYKILSAGLSARGHEIVFKEYSNNLKINVTPKSLRQSCIFKWLQQDHNDSLIKEWMGVAPSYSLKLYKEHINQNIFDDSFLLELYKHNTSQN